MQSFWTFSDVFEEGSPSRQPFDRSFGLIALGGIKKPSNSAFALLHKLGQVRLAAQPVNALATRRGYGSIVIAACNLLDPDQKGSARNVELEIRGVPSDSQVREINRVAGTESSQSLRLSKGIFTLLLPMNGLVLLEIPIAAGVVVN